MKEQRFFILQLLECLPLLVVLGTPSIQSSISYLSTAMSCPTAAFRLALLVALWSTFVSVTAFPTCPNSLRPARRPSRTKTTTTKIITLHAQSDNEDRSQGLRQALACIGQVLTPNPTVRVGSTVVANSNVPALQIWQFQSYTVQAIWDQGVSSTNSDKNYDDTTITTTTTTTTTSSIVEKIPCDTLHAPSPPSSNGGSYTRYVSLYSAKHHLDQQPVTVQYPDEVILVPLRDEVLDSIRMALPLFGFWTALAYSFASKYNERYGGNFWDALFRSKGLWKYKKIKQTNECWQWESLHRELTRNETLWTAIFVPHHHLPYQQQQQQWFPWVDSSACGFLLLYNAVVIDLVWFYLTWFCHVHELCHERHGGIRRPSRENAVEMAVKAPSSMHYWKKSSK